MRGSETADRSKLLGLFCAALLGAVSAYAGAQVFVVEPEHISQQYAHFTPTHIQLPEEPLTTVGREGLIRFFQAEQGFAMRPLPIGVITLHANGGMQPAGDKFIDELHNKGVAAKPGGRVVVTDIRFHDNRIILDLNNGPYHKHRFLRHLSIGMGGYDSTNPVVMDDGPPTGTRICLVFPSRIPDLSGEQVQALLKPMIDFGAKSPAEAYAETLPDFLRAAINQHRVLVGMDRTMVLFAKGEPVQKITEQHDGKPFVIWMYGKAPEPVEFVRFNGSFVERVEIAKVGEPILVHSTNQMGDYWGAQPATVANQHTLEEGDQSAQSIANQNAPAAPPSLRNPGEKLPGDNSGQMVMKPVKFPPGMRGPGAPDETQPASTQPGAPQTSQPSTAGSDGSGSAPTLRDRPSLRDKGSAPNGQPGTTTSSAPTTTSDSTPAPQSPSSPD